MVISKPYSDKKIGDFLIRSFSSDVPEHELVWHRDTSFRLITLALGENWKLQFDNELPFELNPGIWHSVQPNVFHRLIKGTTPLIILIKQF